MRRRLLQAMSVGACVAEQSRRIPTGRGQNFSLTFKVYLRILRRTQHATWWTIGLQFPTEAMMELFAFATASSLALGLIHPPIH